MLSAIRRAFGLQHSSEAFKLSTDPLVAETVRDIVGLQIGPPKRALVTCMNEKPQIQAPDRTQPMLPMRPDQFERRTPTIRGTAPPRGSPDSASPLALLSKASVK